MRKCAQSGVQAPQQLGFLLLRQGMDEQDLQVFQALGCRQAIEDRIGYSVIAQSTNLQDWELKISEKLKFSE